MNEYSTPTFWLIAMISLQYMIACAPLVHINIDKSTGDESQEQGEIHESPTNPEESEAEEEVDNQAQENNENTTDVDEEEEVEEESTCTYDTFDILSSRAFVTNADTEQPIFVYQATNSETYLMDVLDVLSYPGAPYKTIQSKRIFSPEKQGFPII